MNSDKNLPPNFPYILDIELTNKCNLSCKFCNRQFMQREQSFMSDFIFWMILNEIKGENTSIRFIRWGEPFLHEHILNYSKQIKDIGIPLHITTNGLLLDQQKIHSILTIGIDSIIFSLQGLDKVSYESERNNKKYNNLVENIKLLHDIRSNNEKPYITVTTTYTPSKEFTDKDIQYFKGFWKQYADEVKVGITNYSRINNYKGEHIICKEPWQKLSIDWNGEVCACCDDFDNMLSLGNLRINSFHDIWNESEILKSYRNLISNGKHDSLSLCSKCYPAYGDVWKRE